MNWQDRGFTLIELLVVVSIISILAAIAVPNYTQYITKARRTDGQGALTTLANAMERYYTQNYTYLGAGSAANDDGVAESAGVPKAAVFVPDESTSRHYTISIGGATTANTFVLRATPIGGQAIDGYLELTSTGIRSWDRNNDGDTLDANENSWH